MSCHARERLFQLKTTTNSSRQTSLRLTISDEMIVYPEMHQADIDDFTFRKVFYQAGLVAGNFVGEATSGFHYDVHWPSSNRPSSE